MPDDETIDVEEHPFDYTGVHAFLFIDQVQEGRSPEQVVEKLREAGKPPIMYASAFVGDFVAFAHVRVESLSELQNLIDGTIWEAGARCTWGIESPVQTLGAKRKSPGIIALTRIKVQPGMADGARDSLAEAGGTEGFVGASVITGEYDILLQMTGDGIDGTKTNIMNALTPIQDVVMRTSTAFADGDRTAARYGRIPLNATAPDD
jgi:hypothetical protein